MKRTILLCAITLLAQMAYAQRLQPSQVKDSVRQFVCRQMRVSEVMLDRMEIPEMSRVEVYNIKGGGFVIASSDSRVRSVLAYSPTGAIYPDSVPDNARYWLNEYDRQISHLDDVSSVGRSFKPTAARHSAAKSLPDTVAPMLVTAWNQYGNGYNSLTPYDSLLAVDSSLARYEGHVTVGCVPLAMAQVIRYWQFPAHGVGTASVNNTGMGCWNYGVLTVNFSNTEYDYAHMPFQLTPSSTPEEVEAVATLAYHCGVACNAKYNADCHGSTGGNLVNVLGAFTRHFHYSHQAYIAIRNNLSSQVWLDSVKNELAHGRPIICAGRSCDSNGCIGHSFVFDGYDQNDYVHVNWGWNGACDGYYSLDALRPNLNSDYTPNQECVFGLEPLYEPEAVLSLAAPLQFSSDYVCQNIPIVGTYSLTNVGDTVADYYVGVKMGTEWADWHHVHLNPGDTMVCVFTDTVRQRQGVIYSSILYSTDSLQDYRSLFNTTMLYADYASSLLSNVVVAVRFADDGVFSPTDYANSLVALKKRYGELTMYAGLPYISYVTRLVDRLEDGVLFTYQDEHPYGHYLPYSEDNPIGDLQPSRENEFSDRQLQLIANVLRYADSVNSIDNSSLLDVDGDGYVDNLTLFTPHDKPLLMAKEVYAEDGFTYGQVPVKTVNFIPAIDHQATYEDGSAMLREMLFSRGYPRLSHLYQYRDVHPCDGTDVLDNGSLSPSAMVQYKYLNVGSEPVRITQDGTYNIGFGDYQVECYYIPSAIDTNQWYVVEGVYEQEGDMWAKGLLFGRWVDTMSVSRFFGGNALFSYPERANAYWLFRPGSDSDTVAGTHSPRWLLSHPMDSFGPTTDPHPYLADGTPENSFEIYDIQVSEGRCRFSVRFLHEGIDEAESLREPSVTPNPTTGVISLKGIDAGTPIRVYNSYGVMVLNLRYDGSRIDLGGMPAGLYMLCTPTAAMKVVLSR